MAKFKFKFSFKAQGVSLQGTGHCNAETEELGRIAAKRGVAKDLGCDVEAVDILSFSEVRAKKAPKQ